MWERKISHQASEDPAYPTGNVGGMRVSSQSGLQQAEQALRPRPQAERTGKAEKEDGHPGLPTLPRPPPASHPGGSAQPRQPHPTLPAAREPV